MPGACGFLERPWGQAAAEESPVTTASPAHVLRSLPRALKREDSSSWKEAHSLSLCCIEQLNQYLNLSISLSVCSHYYWGKPLI